jgi:hypothetical protein
MRHKTCPTNIFCGILLQRSVFIPHPAPRWATGGLEIRRVTLERSWDFCYTYYSQSPPPADFTPTYGFLGPEISTATAWSGWGLGIVYIISLSPLKVALLFSFITLYLFENTSLPLRDNN